MRKVWDYIMSKKLKLMVIGAHPDDCDINAGGTTLKVLENGGEVCFLSVSNGNHGHHTLTCEQVAARRYKETQTVANRFGINYNVLDIPDCHVEANVANREKVTKAIRDFVPDIIFTHRPCDYHVDHRNASQLVLDSAYLLSVPLFCPEAPAMKKCPVILYMHDNFTHPEPFVPTVSVDIDSKIDLKMEMLSCQESQFFEWMPWIDGYADEVTPDKEGRMKLLYRHWAAKDASNADRHRQDLMNKYGPENGAKIKYAEFFELCEYGSVLTAEELNAILS